MNGSGQHGTFPIGAVSMFERPHSDVNAQRPGTSQAERAMSQDLFGDTLVQPGRSRRRRLLAVCSAALHALVLITIVVIQVFAVGPLPLPRQPLVFEEIRLVHLTDIQVPSPPREPSRSTTETARLNAAPIVEPRGVATETGLENAARTASAVTGVEGGVEGFGSISSIGPTVTAEPPPAAPPAPQVPVRLHRGIVAHDPQRLVAVADAEFSWSSGGWDSDGGKLPCQKRWQATALQSRAISY